MMEALRQARSLAHSDPDLSLRICSDILSKEVDTDVAKAALFLSGYLMIEAERYGMAYHIYSRCAQMDPSNSHIQSNLGVALEFIDQDKALKAFKLAQKLDKENPSPIISEGLIELKKGNPKRCIYLCNKALAIDPEDRQAKHNIALSKLMLKDWGGWKGWSEGLGMQGRQALDYGLPVWDGKSDGNVLVYGEQGVGDEIMYASILEDMAKTNNIVLDTDSRLQDLFSRSFDFPVYGTRFESESPILAEQKLDYQIAIGQLPYFYRSKGEFPGTPYLKANPDYKVMYRALFDTYPGKKIGVAWTGGSFKTDKAGRSLSIDDYSPLFATDNTFISLEYEPVLTSKLEEYGIKHFDATGKGRDIDELAGIISQLDMVITCCTTVTYIAGALGIPCYVLVPTAPSYRYGVEGDFPWYKSVKLIRQKRGCEWSEVVENVIEVANVKSIHRVRPSGDSSVSRMRSVDTETRDSSSVILSDQHKKPSRVRAAKG